MSLFSQCPSLIPAPPQSKLVPLCCPFSHSTFSFLYSSITYLLRVCLTCISPTVSSMTIGTVLLCCTVFLSTVFFGVWHGAGPKSIFIEWMNEWMSKKPSYSVGDKTALHSLVLLLHIIRWFSSLTKLYTLKSPITLVINWFLHRWPKMLSWSPFVLGGLPRGLHTQKNTLDPNVLPWLDCAFSISVGRGPSSI